MRTYAGREVIAALRRAGFEVVSQRGNHVKLRNEQGRTAIVPDHREIAIAEHLGIGVETVKTHVRNVLDKLGATNRAHAVGIAIRKGLL